MNRILSILFLALALPCALCRAQSPFEEANALYADGQYAEAAGAYRVLLQDYPAGTNRETVAYLQYNLGNACFKQGELAQSILCLLYTSPSPRDRTRSRMPSSA